MFDIGWTELLVIGIVALIVVGPKDLPGMFRTLGQFTGKAKTMARDFQRAMNDAADEAGVKDVTSDLKNIANPKGMGLDAVRDAAKGWTSDEPPKAMGSETAKLAAERAEAARKIQEKTAEVASKRIAKEEAARVAAETSSSEAAKPAAAKKPAAKKPAAKTAAKKPAAKPAAKKPEARKPVAKKPAAKKPAAKPSAKDTSA